MLNLPSTLEKQINQLANDSGQSVDVFLDGLITDYIEEQNDIIEADAIYRRIQTGEETTVSFDQLLKDNALNS